MNAIIIIFWGAVLTTIIILFSHLNKGGPKNRLW